MAEDFVSANLVLPGTYIRVRSEGLIGIRGHLGRQHRHRRRVRDRRRRHPHAVEPARGRGGVRAPDRRCGRAVAQPHGDGRRALPQRRAHRPRARVSDSADQTLYTAAFNEVIKEDVQILVAPDLGTTAALAVIPPILESSENNDQDLIAVIGADGADADAVAGAGADQRPGDPGGAGIFRLQPRGARYARSTCRATTWPGRSPR